MVVGQQAGPARGTGSIDSSSPSLSSLSSRLTCRIDNNNFSLRYSTFKEIRSQGRRGGRGRGARGSLIRRLFPLLNATVYHAYLGLNKNRFKQPDASPYFTSKLLLTHVRTPVFRVHAFKYIVWIVVYKLLAFIPNLVLSDKIREPIFLARRQFLQKKERDVFRGFI